MEERTLVLIKPDGLYKSLTGNILTTFSEARLKIVAAKVVKVSRDLAEKHYNNLKSELITKFGEEKGINIYESTMDYLQGKFHTDRVLALVYKGEDAIKRIKTLAGATNPEKAEPHTIRGRYGRIHSEKGIFETAVHCSDTPENAAREIALWFNKDEIVE